MRRTLLAIAFLSACSSSPSSTPSAGSETHAARAPATLESPRTADEGSGVRGTDLLSPICDSGAQVTTGVTFDLGTTVLGVTSHDPSFVVLSTSLTPTPDGTALWYSVTAQNNTPTPERFAGDVAFQAAGGGGP